MEVAKSMKINMEKEQVYFCLRLWEKKVVFQFLCRLGRLWQIDFAMHVCLLAFSIDQGNIFAVCMAWPSWCCAAPTSYPTGTQYVIQMLRNWFHFNWTKFEYSFDQILPSPCWSELARETRCFSAQCTSHSWPLYQV